MKQREFEQLVSNAISALPPAGQTAMKNVAFFVEPEVREVKADEIGIKKGELLLGLYEGVSKLNRGSGYFGVLPDKITIFQQPIELIAENKPEKIKQIIFEVVYHEVGHHLGFDEDGIRAHKPSHNKKMAG